MVKLKREDDYKVLDRIETKLDALTSTLAVTCEIVGRHDKDINGNGQPGLNQKVATLENSASEAKGKAKGTAQLWSAIISVAVGVMTYFITRWGGK
jgi:hypothetical protein